MGNERENKKSLHRGGFTSVNKVLIMNLTCNFTMHTLSGKMAPWKRVDVLHAVIRRQRVRVVMRAS